MKHLRWALLCFFWGVLLYPVLINLVGFASPLVAIMRYGDQAIGHEMDLLNQAKMVLPLFSFLFLLGTWFLSRLTGKVGRILLLVTGVGSTAITLTHAYLPLGDGNWKIFLDTLYLIFDLLLLTVPLAIAARFCKVAELMQTKPV